MKRIVARLSIFVLLLSMLMNGLPATSVIATVDDDWDKSSLKFIDQGGDCDEIWAEIMNGQDSEDMKDTVQYKVYYSPTGNPKPEHGGTVVATGTVSELESGASEALTYNPTEPGKYMFWASQRPGHPGQGELWSDEISVNNCEEEQPELQDLVITSVCTDKPSEKRKWTVFNPNDFEVNYTWELGTQSESGSINANSSVTFMTNTEGDNVLHLYYGEDQHVSKESNGEDCSPPEPELEDLTIQSVCTDEPSEERKWTVSNPNDVDVTFTWELGTQSDEVTVKANTSVTFTTDTEGDNILHVYFGEDQHVKKESNGEDCSPSEPELKVLTIKSVCTDEPSEERKWTVSNPNDVDVTFTWKLGTQSDEVTVNANDSVSFTTDTEGDNILHVYYGDDQHVSKDSNGEDCTPPPPPEEIKPLTIQSVCTDEPTQKRAWKITNSNNVAVQFDWKLETQSGQKTVGAKQTITFETTTEGDNILHIYYDEDQHVMKSSNGEDCSPPPPPPQLDPISINTVCTEDPSSTRAWTVSNSNEVSVTFTWKVTGTTQQGTMMLKANETQTIITDAIEGKNTLEVWVDGKLMTSMDSPGDACDTPPPPPPEDLQPLVLGEVCSEDPSETRAWTVTNPNDSDLMFSWEIVGSDQSGKLLVRANSQVSFFTSTIEGENILQVTVDGEDPIQLSSNGESCEEPPPVDPPTDPPPVDPPSDPPSDPPTDDPGDEEPVTELPKTSNPWYNMLVLFSTLLVGSGVMLFRLRKSW